jgi:hypothetical protein
VIRRRRVLVATLLRIRSEDIVHNKPRGLLTRQEISQIVAVTFVGWVLLACVAMALQRWTLRGIPSWKIFVLLLLSAEAGRFANIFILRPLRGQPPLFRFRYGDDFATYLGGGEIKWSRLFERYSSDELILLVGVLIVLLGGALASAIAILK